MKEVRVREERGRLMVEGRGGRGAEDRSAGRFARRFDMRLAAVWEEMTKEEKGKRLRLGRLRR